MIPKFHLKEAVDFSYGFRQVDVKKLFYVELMCRYCRAHKIRQVRFFCQ